MSRYSTLILAVANLRQEQVFYAAAECVIKRDEAVALDALERL